MPLQLAQACATIGRFFQENPPRIHGIPCENGAKGWPVTILTTSSSSAGSSSFLVSFFIADQNVRVVVARRGGGLTFIS